VEGILLELVQYFAAIHNRGSLQDVWRLVGRVHFQMTMSSDGDEYSYFHSHKREIHARAAPRNLTSCFLCRKIHGGKIFRTRRGSSCSESCTHTVMLMCA
jgi:hypothetical protein